MNIIISKTLAIILVIISITTTGLSLYEVIIDHSFTRKVYSKNYTNDQVLDVDNKYVVSEALNFACDYEKDTDKSIYKTRINISYNLPYTVINLQNIYCIYYSSETINNKIYHAICSTLYIYCNTAEHAIILLSDTECNNTNYININNKIILNMSSFTLHVADNIIPGINMIFGLPLSIIFLIICCIMAFFEPINNRYQKLGNNPRIISMYNNNNNTDSTDSSESTEATV